MRQAREQELWLERLDSFLDRVVVVTPEGRSGIRWGGVVASLLLVAVSVRWMTGVVDLFALPVLVAVFVFRYRGLWIIPLNVLLYHLVSLQHVSLRLLLFSDGVNVVEWALLAGFILLTLDRYSAVRRLQARIHQDLHLARTVQTALTQKEYDFGKVRIDGSIRQASDVGGDFYYFRPFQKKYVVLCLGDVMGKGISASLLMAMVMGFMFEWGKKSPSPRFILRKLNHRLTRLWGRESHWFITLFYAVYNEETSVMTYAAAGHQAGVVLRKSGGLDAIAAEGLPVGVLERVEFVEEEVRLEPGDRVVLFTDGVTEARSPAGTLFSLERLNELIFAHRLLPARGLLELIENRVQEHCGGRLTDDMALLIMEVKA